MNFRKKVYETLSMCAIRKKSGMKMFHTHHMNDKRNLSVMEYLGERHAHLVLIYIAHM